MLENLGFRNREAEQREARGERRNDKVLGFLSLYLTIYSRVSKPNRLLTGSVRFCQYKTDTELERFFIILQSV